MSNNQENLLIRNICLNIKENILKNRKEVFQKIELNLESKYEKSEDEHKYHEAIKYNVMHYKISIRSTEHLLSKLIESKNIYNKDIVEAELKRVSLNCKQYVSKAIQTKGESFNQHDLKVFLSYDNMDNLKNRLENEYKILSIYNDVLNIFIKKLSTINKEKLNSFNNDENINFIKAEIRKTVNDIVKPVYIEKSKQIENKEDKLNVKEINKNDIDTKDTKQPIDMSNIEVEEACITKEEPFEPLNDIEISYLNLLDNINEDKLIKQMDKEYKILCVLEEMDFNEAYSFGRDSIKDYIGALTLLNISDEHKSDLIKSGVRLLINGEFGSINFGEYIEHIAVEVFNIGADVWNEGNKIIADKFKKATNHPLVEKEVKEYRNDIDLQEYVYMIENADKTVKFRK